MAFVGIEEIEKAVRPVEERLESGGVEQKRSGRSKILLGKTRAKRPINGVLGRIEIIPGRVEPHHRPTQGIDQAIEDGW